MKTVEIRVDSLKGRLKAKGTLYAGSKVQVSFSPEAGDTAQLGLFVFDRRQYEQPRIEPRISVFPPPGLKCIAVTEREGDALVLDLNVQELLDLFADGKRKPGSKVLTYLYLWDVGTPEVVAMGETTVEWSPVYFTPQHTPVSMKGDPGEKGDPGRDGEDAIVGNLPAGRLVAVDATGKHLADAGHDAEWLDQRVTAFRNANGSLVLTTGYLP